MKPILNFLALFSLVLSLISCGTTGGPPGIGKKAANFRLNTLEHERFYLNQHKGKVVVLVFWTTWCRACKTEMKVLQDFTALPVWRDVTVAAVCTDPENLSDAKSIVENLKISYPVLLDPGARLFHKFQLTAYPTTLIFDRQQRLSFLRVGYDQFVMNQVKSKVLSLVRSDSP
ncbi:MAG: TlpA family protein disulfide reductase [Candidatus Aminicenantes bacterium]|nr:MAG: TlpA family protein disulfide reductase [Candidatus Aminicenantes bacterium]